MIISSLIFHHGRSGIYHYNLPVKNDWTDMKEGKEMTSSRGPVRFEATLYFLYKVL